MKISTSITDFAPLLLDPKLAFRKIKETGVDSIELIMGLKFRFSAKKILKLSKTYDLPIVTIHQPIWSGLGLLDEGFVAKSLQLGVKDIVFHPLMKDISLDHPQMENYFEKLSKLQEKYGITVMLENMPLHHDRPWLNHILPLHPHHYDMMKMVGIAKKYNFSLTFDTSHYGEIDPHTHDWFKITLPFIKNIHLSSFKINGKHHLPLNMGDFKSKEFIRALLDFKYENYLTLEIQYPGLVNFFGYNTKPIMDSVKIFRNLTASSD